MLSATRRFFGQENDEFPAAEQDNAVEDQRERWKSAGVFDRLEDTLAHQIAMSGGGGGQARGGLDFYTLARGTDRSYSCSFLINLDPDLLSLCSREDATTLDLARDALINHTKRIFNFITMKAYREVNQFCFGSTYVHLNPNYRRFDRMDPMTWKKEGIASRWTGGRGYRKTCCKVCCQDKTCTGCTVCKKCVNGPVRGNYDGLVVLTAVTRESLPNQPVVLTKRAPISKKSEEKLPDHEMFSISLETLLSTHFMYGDPEYQSRCVPSSRSSVLLGDTIDDIKKHKKYSGYVVYVAYRLEPASSISHSLRLSKMRAAQNGTTGENEGEKTEVDKPAVRDQNSTGSNPGFAFDFGRLDENGDDADFDAGELFGSNNAFDDGPFRFPGDADANEVKLLEDLEDKQLLARIKDMEAENSKLTEKVWKLEHGRTWVENRLTALESELISITGRPLDKGSESEVPLPE